MVTQYYFPSIIEDSFNAAFYDDTIQLAEIYLTIVAANHQDISDNENDSKVLFHLASSYHLTGSTGHAIYLLENEKKLDSLNSFLLARYYFTLKNYDKFIQFSMAKITYRPENDQAHLIIQKFGKYSGFVMKLLSQHLYSINKRSQAESMLSFSLEVNPFIISALHRSIQQDGNRNPFDHFKSFIKSNRKRTSNDIIDTKAPPMTTTLASVQHNNHNSNNNNSESSKFVPTELQFSDQLNNYNENTIAVSGGIPSKMDIERNIHSPKQITGTLAASTPMNVANNNVFLQPSKNYDSNSVIAAPVAAANNIINTTPFNSGMCTFDQTALAENTNHSSSTTHYKTPQPRFNPIHVYDQVGCVGAGGCRDPAVVRARVGQRSKMNDCKESKTPKNIQFDSSCLSESNSYTSESLSLPIPDINSHARNMNNDNDTASDDNGTKSNDEYNLDNLTINPLQSTLDAMTNRSPPATTNDCSDSNDALIDDISAGSINFPEIQPPFASSSKPHHHLLLLPDSILKERTPTSLAFAVMDVLYKTTKIQYYMFRYDCDQVIRLYDLLPSPIRTLPNFMSTLAVAQFHKHKYEACINIFRRLQLDYPFYCDGFEYYSTALWHTNKLARLEKLAAFLKHHMPMCAQTWITSGNFYSLSKRHDIAIQCFKRSLQLDPKNAYASALLGKEYWDLDHAKEAFACYKRGLLNNRYCYQLWYLISESHMHKQQFSLAEQCINTAIRINAHDPVVWSLAAAVDFANNHFVAAINKIDRALLLNECNESFLIFKVNILMRIKKWIDAKDILLNIIGDDKTTDNATQIYLLLGKIYLSMEDFQTAESYLTKCIDIDLGGIHCAEARKVMGKIGLLQGGLCSKKNSLLDVQSDHYLAIEFKPAQFMLDFIRKKET